MKSALVVVDVQNFFMNDSTKHVPERILNLISKRKFDFIVFFKFVNSKNSNFSKFLNWNKMFASPDIDIVPVLQTFVNKTNVFSKSTFSAFKDKKFLKFVKSKKISRIYICGFDTDGCVMATALDAFDMGVEVKILEDLCASHHGKSYHRQAIKLLKRNAAQLISNSKSL